MPIIVFIFRIAASLFNIYMLILVKKWLNENPKSKKRGMSAGILTTFFFINFLFSAAIL